MRDIAIFVALGFEISPLKTLLAPASRVYGRWPVYVGEFEGQGVVLVKSGVGRDRALGAASFIQSRYMPKAVLSTGFAGGLVPELQPADVILGLWSVRPEDHPGLASKRILAEAQAAVLLKSLSQKGIRVRTGGFACVRRPVISSTERQDVARKTGAVIAEMETFYLGEFFVARKIPFLGMRAVVDSFQDRVPLSGRSKFEPRRGVSTVTWHMMFQGGGLGYLLRLYQNGRRAQKTLAQSVAALLKTWP
jgi:adenosylhomocysteine nucleosidase